MLLYTLGDDNKYMLPPSTVVPESVSPKQFIAATVKGKNGNLPACVVLNPTLEDLLSAEAEEIEEEVEIGDNDE